MRRISIVWLGRAGLLAAVVLALGAAIARPALADPYLVFFTGSGGNGSSLSGWAEVPFESLTNDAGINVPVLAFSAAFTGLAAGGSPVDSVTFTLDDVSDARFFTGISDGVGYPTLSFDLNGTGPNQSELTGHACYDYCFVLESQDGTGYSYYAIFGTNVTSYAPVPEPAGTAATLGAALLGLGVLRARAAAGRSAQPRRQRLTA